LIDIDSDPFAKSVLIAVADACDYSIHAHVPEGAILRKFKSHLQGDARNILKKLAKTPYILRHPTGRNTTFNITQDGLTKAQE
jgi:hypothetical protein